MATALWSNSSDSRRSTASCDLDIAVEHQGEADRRILIFGVGEEKVDGYGVVVIAVGEGNLVVDGVVVFVNTCSSEPVSRDRPLRACQESR